MAVFNWVLAPPSGTCLTCGASTDQRGFIDMIADTTVVREGYEISGVVDIVVCATCLEQASRMVGCASRDEVYAFAERELALMNELEQVKDEVVSARQKVEQDLMEFFSTEKIGSD